MAVDAQVPTRTAWVATAAGKPDEWLCSRPESTEHLFLRHAGGRQLQRAGHFAYQDSCRLFLAAPCAVLPASIRKAPASDCALQSFLHSHSGRHRQESGCLPGFSRSWLYFLFPTLRPLGSQAGSRSHRRSFLQSALQGCLKPGAPAATRHTGAMPARLMRLCSDIGVARSRALLLDHVLRRDYLLPSSPLSHPPKTC